MGGSAIVSTDHVFTVKPGKAPPHWGFSLVQKWVSYCFLFPSLAFHAQLFVTGGTQVNARFHYLGDTALVLW